MQFIKKNKFHIFIFSSIFLITAYLYRDSFSAYFFQDDWFSFSISQTKGFSDVLRFFLPRTDVIYYRPLGMQIPFFFVQTFFGLEPFVFRAITFLLHSLNTILVFGILTRLIKNKYLSIVGVIIYALSAVHFTPFYWAATFAFVFSPTWYLAAIYSFLHHKHRWVLLFFICGLFTNEMLVTLPLTLLLIHSIERKNRSRRFFGTTVFISFVYLVFRYLYRPTFEGNYSLGFEPVSFIKTIRDYFLWSVNFPEEISNQFVSFFTFNQDFSKSFSTQIGWWTTNGLQLIVMGLVSIYFAVRDKKRILLIRMGLGILWFFLTLAPLLIFREHAYSYYLPIPFVGLTIFLISSMEIWVSLFAKRQKELTLLILGMLFIFINSSYHTINFNKDVHWAPRRAVIAQKMVGHMQRVYPDVPEDAIIVVKGNDEYKWALGDQHAFQVIYGSELIQTVYQNENEPSDRYGADDQVIHVP